MKIALSILFVCLIGLPFRAPGAEPSTPVQRQRFIEIVNGLEKDAFSDSARTDRSWALTFIDRAPDIRVEIVTSAIRELTESGIPNRPAVYSQFVLGAAKYIVEHPDHADDKVAAHEAAFVSCLAVYRQAVALDPANQIVIFDAIAQKARDGTLHSYVVNLLSGQGLEENKTL